MSLSAPPPARPGPARPSPAATPSHGERGARAAAAAGDGWGERRREGAAGEPAGCSPGRGVGRGRGGGGSARGDGSGGGLLHRRGAELGAAPPQPGRLRLRQPALLVSAPGAGGRPAGGQHGPHPRPGRSLGRSRSPRVSEGPSAPSAIAEQVRLSCGPPLPCGCDGWRCGARGRRRAAAGCLPSGLGLMRVLLPVGGPDGGVAVGMLLQSTKPAFPAKVFLVGRSLVDKTLEFTGMVSLLHLQHIF